MSWHKKDWLLAALGIGGAAAGGAGLLGLLGPAAEAGAGAAELGAGAGAWSGAAAPYAGELASVGEAGGTMLGGAPPQEISGLLGSGGNSAGSLKNVQRAKYLFDLAQQQQGQGQHPAPAAPRPPPQLDDNTLELIRRIWPHIGG